MDYMKKTNILIICVSILILMGVVYFVASNASKEPTNTFYQYYAPYSDLKVDLQALMDAEVSKQAALGNNIQVSEVVAYKHVNKSEVLGQVYLKCDNNSPSLIEIAESINNSVFELQKSKYSEINNFDFRVSSCGNGVSIIEGDISPNV
jgi:hypothetical protein